MQGLPKVLGAHSRALAVAIILTIAVALPAFLVAAAPASARSARAGGAERHVVALINRIRHRNGLPRVRLSGGLLRAAQSHTVDMAVRGFFAHNSSNGTSAATRVRSFTGAQAVGENLAFISGGSRRAAAKVVAMWMNSPPHRAVILSRWFRRIGVSARIARIGRGLGTVFTADFSSNR